MASDWIECSITDVAAPIKNALVGGPFGSNLVSRDYTPLGVPVIRGQNMGYGRWVEGEFVYVSHDKAKALSPNTAHPGDLIFTQRGTLGQVAIVPQGPFERYIISQSQMKLTVDPNKADALFLYYVFMSTEQQAYIVRNAIQTGVPHTNLEHLRTTPLTLPPLSEQHAIAHILGTLDDKIELNRRMNETLEALARAIFKSWFVDFDPVRAKVEGRQPAGMDAETAALFPAEFEDSALGQIPRGWKVGPLSEIATVTMGASPSGDTYNDVGNGVPLINGPVEFGEYFAVKSKWTTSPTRLSEVGDLIFCVRGSTTGRRVIADDVYCLGRGVCAIQSRHDCQPFIYQVINFGLERLLARTSGSVFPNLSGADISQFEILIPPQELMRGYCLLTETLTKRIWQNVKESETLATLRDTLLPKLLSGEVRVKEIEKSL